MLVSALHALDVATRGAPGRLLARSLREVTVALRHRPLPVALKLIDRAWRTLPDAVHTLAPLYGRLLLLEDRDPDAALRVLARVECPDADVAALTARAMFMLRRPEDARRTLEAALRKYSVALHGLLWDEASAALDRAELQLPGWIGTGPTLELVGELAPGHSPESLRLFAGDVAIEASLRLIDRDRRLQFSFPAPSKISGAKLRATSGEALLGSGQQIPPEFALDGRIEGATRRLHGWARLGWLPAQPLRLRFEDEHGNVVVTHTRKAPLAGFRWPFQLDPRDRGLRGDRIEVLARLPDGRWQKFPDSPLLLPGAVRARARRVPVQQWIRREPAPQSSRPAPLSPSVPIDIIIPVYRGLRESLACIQSVLSTTGDHARVVVVDDATPESHLASALDELAASGRIELLRNENNLGFVRSVNRALRHTAGHDVVLLNSDTVVFEDWLRRLRAAAYRAPRVGTVTPLSNDGSIASYPHRYGGSLDAAEGASIHQLAARTHAGISAEIPVGVGFCLYMRHDCLKEVGELDAETFSAGYGEESDFCLRARLRGWVHRIAADVFVYHAGGGSFGLRRAALLERSQRLLNLRYPGYDAYITRFLRQDRLLPLRRALDAQRLGSFAGRFILLVTLALEGGVEQFVAQRRQEIRAQGLMPLVLKPQSAGDARHCEILADAIDVPNLRYTVPAELPELTALLAGLTLERIEIHHFLDLDPAVIDALRALGVPYDVMIHDYAWVCPRITMIDGSGRYCREPPVSVCESCVRRNGSRLPKSLSVAALRARSTGWLRHASSVHAPSTDTAARVSRYFPGLDIRVRPHTPHTSSPYPTLTAPAGARPSSRNSRRLRVALIGAIGGHKGYRILLECARDAAARRLPLEFVVIGYTENDRRLLRSGRVEVTGRYVDEEAPHLLRREQPDLLFLPSVWPETWCYALDHALRTSLPIVAFDIGAMAERLRAVGEGGGARPHTLLGLDLGAREINERLLELGGYLNATPYVQTREPGLNNMANIKETTEKKSMTTGDRPADEGLSASVQVLPLLPGLYLFSVKSATPAADAASGVLRLPAMHVGLGPGVRSEQVEFVAGPSTEGAWLFSRGDVLVAKVNGAGATLILTSVRAVNGEVLSIAVERLETRSQPTSAVAREDNAVAEPPAIAARAGVQGAPPQAAVRRAAETFDDGSVPLQIKTHIRARGDLNFVEAPWAGRVAPGLWMESFSVLPLKALSAHDIEYKGLTGTGFETPWLSDDQNCGTKGMSVPLVGFALRLRSGAETAGYDCEYSGYFQSGTLVGPLRNGAPCRSTVANDPLEGIQIRLIRRAMSASATSGQAAVAAGSETRRAVSATAAGGSRRKESLAATAGTAVAEGKMSKRATPAASPER
jgi:GT2 family glycosyltransferase